MEAKKNKKASLEGLKGIFFEVGLVTALFVMIAAFSWSSKGTSSILDLSGNAGDVIEDFDIPITNPDDTPPPPPTDVAMPIVTTDLLLVDNTVEVSNFNLFDPEKYDAPIVEVPYVKPVIVEDEEEIEGDIIDVIFVQDKPTFMGGDANEFSKWVNSRIVYPTVALENRIQGRVILQFKIDTEGRVGDIKVVRSVHPAIDKEAVRVVALSPLWTPGRQLNKKVSVRYTFPVNFVISE